MADVFISYASEDRDRVRPLADALQGRGFSIWWDRSLAAGQDYASIIERELKDAKAVIVVWTQGAAASTFVRDEAGRARDQGRLVPVMLDPVQIPLGFGAFQAEDFTKWNGQRGAAQVQLLEESIKAKLEGRDVDSVAVARKRRRLGARIRLVSLLTVIALVVGIAAFGKYIFVPEQHHATQEDLKAQLLQLLAEGKLTPEQAIQLAGLLQTDALGTQTASNDGAATGPSMAAPGAPAPSASESRTADGEAIPASALVSEQEFNTASTEAYDAAFSQVLQHPDALVRLSAVQMTNPATRDAAIQSLWAYAQAHPDDPLRDEIYLACGVIAERNDNPLAQRALEQATTLSPQDGRAWRLLSRSYRRTGQANDAQGAALVGNAVEAQAQGNTQQAEQQLQEALPQLSDTPNRAFVASSLGAIAEQRQDWTSASARYAEAYRLREQASTAAPNSAVAAEGLEQDAQRLVVALDRSGRSREACQRLQQAQDDHAVDAPDQALVDRCTTQFRMHVRPGVLSPNRTNVQRAPVQRVTPAPATTP